MEFAWRGISKNKVGILEIKTQKTGDVGVVLPKLSSPVSNQTVNITNFDLSTLLIHSFQRRIVEKNYATTPVEFYINSIAVTAGNIRYYCSLI